MLLDNYLDIHLITLLLYGFKNKVKIRENIKGFLELHYPNVVVKYADTKKSCLKLLNEDLVSCIIVNQIEDNPDLFRLLKSIETNLSYSRIPLIGLNSSGKNLNLNISDSFIATLFVPIDFDELKMLMENNVKGIVSEKAKTGKQTKFDLKEKYDTRKSCFARCEAINDSKNNVIDYKFVEINPEFADFLDMMIEEIYDSTVKKIFPEPGNMLVELFNSTPENGKPVYYEYYSESGNKYFEVIAYKYNPTIVNAIIIDTTEKKEEEENLIKQKEKFGGRVKELRCLYNITRILSEKHISIEEMLKKVIILIPWAFKYPAIAKVRIKIWDMVEESVDYTDTEWKIEENLIMREKRVGKISISYQEEKPKEYIGPFLKDEVNLLRSICELLAGSIEKFEVRDDLSKLNERFDIAYKSADFGVWDWDISDNKLLIDDKYLEIIGEKSNVESINRDNWLESIHPDDRLIIDQKMEETLSGIQNLFTQEFRIKTRAGSWKWIKDIGKVVKQDDLGKPLWMTGMIRDIDEEKRNQIELENRLEFEKILIDFIKFYSGLQEERFEEGINKITSDFSKFLGSEFSELVFIDTGNSDYKIKEIVKHKFNGSNSSLNFSKISNSLIFSSISQRKILKIPDKIEVNKEQSRILDEANAKTLLFIPLVYKQELIGYNLHYFNKTEKQISLIDYDLIEIYADLLSGMLQKKNQKETITDNFNDNTSLIMKFFPGLIHEINSPSQYISDNLDFIKENTVNYNKVLKEIKSAISDKKQNDISEVIEIFNNNINGAKIEKVTGEINESFKHIYIGLENIQDIIASINEFTSGTDFKNHIEINKMLKAIIGFTRNEWKYHCKVKYSSDNDSLMIFANKADLYRAFLYLLINVVYLVKKNKNSTSNRKNINVDVGIQGDKVNIEFRFSDPEFSAKKIKDLFNNNVEIKTENWTLAEKFEFCRTVFTQDLSGEFIIETKGKSFKFSVLLPIELQE